MSAHFTARGLLEAAKAMAENKKPYLSQDEIDGILYATYSDVLFHSPFTFRSPFWHGKIEFDEPYVGPGPGRDLSRFGGSARLVPEPKLLPSPEP